MDQQQLWKEMIKKSFHPRQWYVKDDDIDEKFEAALPTSEETFMWVYQRIEAGCYTVGYYDPTGKWHTDSDHATSEEAAERVSYLNGGRTRINSGPVHEAAKRGFHGEEIKG